VIHEWKTKGKLSLYGLTESHDVNGITAPVILNLGTKYRLFSFMTRPVYPPNPGGKIYPAFIKGLIGSQNQSGELERRE